MSDVCHYCLYVNYPHVDLCLSEFDMFWCLSLTYDIFASRFLLFTLLPLCETFRHWWAERGAELYLQTQHLIYSKLDVIFIYYDSLWNFILMHCITQLEKKKHLGLEIFYGFLYGKNINGMSISLIIFPFWVTYCVLCTYQSSGSRL